MKQWEGGHILAVLFSEDYLVFFIENQEKQASRQGSWMSRAPILELQT